MTREWLKRKTDNIKKYFTDDIDEERRSVLVVVGLGTGAILLTACSEETLWGLTEAATAKPTGTSEILNPGETVTLTSTLRPSETPVPSEIMTPTPQESCLINGTVFTENNRHPDGGYKYPADVSKIDKPLNEWTQAERTTIVDAAGNPIYEGVRAIANSRWVSENQLKYVGTWIGKGCGYGLMFDDNQGEKVWATNILGMAMGRPDGNGLGIGVQTIPNPGVEGHMELVVGKEQTLVLVRGTDQIIGRYNPVTQTWDIEPAFRIPETPTPTMTTAEQQHPGWKEVMAREIGPNWESYKECDGLIRFKGICVLTGVTDGQVITDPITITTSENKVLATMKAGIRIYYLDDKGRLQSIIKPKIIQLDDGKLYAYNFGYINETKMRELVASQGYMEADRPGLVVATSVATDVQEFVKSAIGVWGSDLPQAHKDVWALADEHQKSRAEEMQEFISSGNPQIGIFFPMMQVSGSERELTLP